jgi:hypothetical protein
MGLMREYHKMTQEIKVKNKNKKQESISGGRKAEWVGSMI